MIDNHTATQHEFTRRCLRFFYGGIDENIDQNEYDGSEDDLREYAATINEGLGYNLDAQIAAITAERDSLRVRIRDIAWAALKYEDATYRVKTYPSNGQYKRQLKIIHNILKAAQAEFGPDSNQL